MAEVAIVSTQQRADLQLVVFDVGCERFGVSIDKVREIIPMQQVTQIPRAPSFVRGVIDLRGLVIPVIDLRERFAMPRGGEGDDKRIIVVEMAGQMVGCTVDEVSEVLTIAAASVEPAPAVTTSAESAYLLGVARHDGRLVVLLDLDRLLDESERHALVSVGAGQS
jgi:purine-binding chemotaxis protein CheW